MFGGERNVRRDLWISVTTIALDGVSGQLGRWHLRVCCGVQRLLAFSIQLRGVCFFGVSAHDYTQYISQFAKTFEFNIIRLLKVTNRIVQKNAYPLKSCDANPTAVFGVNAENVLERQKNSSLRKIRDAAGLE